MSQQVTNNYMSIFLFNKRKVYYSILDHRFIHFCEQIGMKNCIMLFQKLKQIIAQFIATLTKAYTQFSIEYRLEREYLEKVILTLVAPVSMQMATKINQCPYFTINEESFEKNGPDSNKKQKRKFSNGIHKEEVPIKQLNIQRQSECKLLSKPEPKPGSCINKNMLYQVHPSTISLSQNQEKQLCQWIKNQYQLQNPATKILVRKKARKILGSKYFQATEGWMKRFLYRNPKMKNYLISSSENPQEHSDDSDSSRGWIGIQDHQLSHYQLTRLLQEEGSKLSPHDIQELVDKMDPGKVGLIPYQSLRQIKNQNDKQAIKVRKEVRKNQFQNPIYKLNNDSDNIDQVQP